MRRLAALHTVALAVGLAAASPGRAGVAEDAPATVPPPAAVPTPDVATRAESVVTQVRAIEGALGGAHDLGAIDAQLHALHERSAVRFDETTRTLEDQPPLVVLDAMLEPWLAFSDRAARIVADASAVATSLESDLQRLDRLQQVWALTQQAAEADQAPAAVLERIAATRHRIAQAQARVVAHRARVLALLDRATEEQLHATEAVDRIRQARRAVIANPFVRDRVPLWQLAVDPQSLAGFGERIASAFADDVALTRYWLDDRGLALLVQAAAAVLLTLLFGRMHRDAQRWSVADPALARQLVPLARPLACALTIVLLFGEYGVPLEIRTVREGLGLLALVPVATLAIALVPKPLHAVIWATAAFFTYDRVREITMVAPEVERLLFLFELVALVAVLLSLARRLEAGAAAEAGIGAAPAAEAGWLPRVAGIARVLAAVIAVTLVAAIAGYSRPARLVDVGLLSATYAGVGFVVVARVAEATLGWALRVRPLRLLHLVRDHRRLVESRARLLIRVLVAAAWASLVLQRMGLWDPMLSRLRTLLDSKYSRGEFNLSVGDVVAFVAALWVATLLSRFLRFVLEEDVFPRVELARGLPAALSSLLHYAVVTAGLLAGFAMLGLTLNQITILASALGVGIGFGLQTIVNNFVSGLILLLERPVQVGDSVQLGPLIGEVHRIGIRASTVRTWQGAEVIVPNATLVSDQLTNWTLSDRLVRIELKVGTPDDVDPARMLEVLRGVASRHPSVLPEPAPEALFSGFGEDGLEFELRAWTARIDGRFEEWQRVRSELGVALWAELGAAGITLSNPVRDLRLTEVDPGAARVLQGMPARG